MTYSAATSCRVCSSDRLTNVLDLGEQFVSDFVDRDQVDKGVKCPLVLDHCSDCTLVQARYAPPPEILYKRQYWYRSGVTDTMRAALRDVTKAVEDRVELFPYDVVVDVGSNDGTLLRSYSRDVFKIGVEPAENLKTEGSVGVDELLSDFWPLTTDHQLSERSVKVVTAIGMFYDLQDPNPFIREVARVLTDDGLFVAQMMGLRQTLVMTDVGNLAHEHLEFYTLESIRRLYEAHGLFLTEVETNDVNGGSYRLFARKRKTYAEQRHPLSRHSHEPGVNLFALSRFNDAIKRQRDAVRQFVAQERAAGKRFAVYGASTKGNVMLQYWGLDRSVIEMAADRDPSKWGKYTVGTGIPIVSEEHARAARPDYLLCLPYAFKTEFVERERAFRADGGRMVFPVPELEII